VIPPSIDLTRVALKLRRTRIIATAGPACAEVETLGRLVDAGVDAFRLNFSHGTHATHRRLAERIRAVAQERGRHVAILADLCGPKIRVGRFPDGPIPLEDGAEVVVTTRKVAGAPGLIPSEYRSLARDVGAGDRLLLDDGSLELCALDVSGTELRCAVVRGGTLSDRKGINLPGVHVSAPALTDKDREDALFAAGLGVDWLALSFVRSAADVEELKALLAGAGHALPVVAKIERAEALREIGGILTVADGVMVARGDLGVELEPEEVPVVQQQLVRAALSARRSVIVATQMLESMIERPRPTRAEVSDVATAALGGADAVMLSGETAVGRHPVEAVEAMDRTLRLVESYQWEHGLFPSQDEAASGRDPLLDALSRATSLLSKDLEVRAIVVPAVSGRTARTVAAVRPDAPIVAASMDAALCRRLALHWGLRPCLVEASALDDPSTLAPRLAREVGVAEAGDLLLLVWDASPERTSKLPTVSLLRA